MNVNWTEDENGRAQVGDVRRSELDGCVFVAPSVSAPDDDAAAAKMKGPKPLGWVEDACLDDVNPDYPWA